MSDLTPANLRVLAARAEQMATDVDAAHVALRGATDRFARRLGYTLDDDAGWLRQVASHVTETAEELELVLGRTAPGHRACEVESGGCPDHGGTLTTATPSGSAGPWRCTTPGCGRIFDWRIGDLPCLEPAAFTVLDVEGTAMDLCAGHTVEARRRLVGARVLPLRPAGEGSR
jgi:hypothetical protein